MKLSAAAVKYKGYHSSPLSRRNVWSPRASYNNFQHRGGYKYNTRAFVKQLKSDQLIKDAYKSDVQKHREAVIDGGERIFTEEQVQIHCDPSWCALNLVQDLGEVTFYESSCEHCYFVMNPAEVKTKAAYKILMDTDYCSWFMTFDRGNKDNL